MKIRFCLKEYYSDKRGDFLAVQISGEAKTTYEQFVENNRATHADLLDEVADRIYRMAQRTGIRDNFFKPQGKNSVHSFRGTGKLRIYCLKYGSASVVLGGGGVKVVRTYQEDEVLYKPVRLLQAIDRCLKENEVNFADLLNYTDIEMEIDV